MRWVLVSIMCMLLAGCGCEPLAKVYGKSICREDVMTSSLEQDLVRESKGKGQVLVKDALRHKIFEVAFLEKFGADALLPTEEEEAHMEEDGHVTGAKARLKMLKKKYEKLKAREMDAREKKRLKEYYESAIKDYMDKEERGKVAYYKDDPTMGRFRSWKKNKALYQHYGGKVAQARFGPEPHDAYKAFMRDIQNEGELEIYEPEHRDAFFPFENYMKQPFRYVSGAQADQAFEKPIF